MCFDTFSSHCSVQQTETLKQSGCTFIPARLPTKLEKDNSVRKKAGKFQTKYALSEQQPLMFVMVDKVGRSNDKSLSLSPRPKEKHTFWRVTHTQMKV